jgi:hypothetical protein
VERSHRHFCSGLRRGFNDHNPSVGPNYLRDSISHRIDLVDKPRDEEALASLLVQREMPKLTLRS